MSTAASTAASIQETHDHLASQREGTTCSGCLRCYVANGVHVYDKDCPDCYGTGCRAEHTHELAAALEQGAA